MKILILHRIPYPKIEYQRGIDHHLHEVVYLGDKLALDNIPVGLPCQKIQRVSASLDDCLRALATVRLTSFDRIISLSEYELLLAAALRERLAVAGPDIEQVTLVRDKVKMKAAVAAAGIQVPGHHRANDTFTWAPGWSGRTVLKPIDGASSEGVQVFASWQDAAQVVAQLPPDDLGLWEIEEFVDGNILHFDGLIAKGRIVEVVASRYVGTCLDFAKGAPLGSVQVPFTLITEQLGVREWVQKCLGAVKLWDGAFHLEAIATRDGLVFLEVGARVGGADVVACFEMATGMHLPSAELALIMGADVPSSRQPQRYYGWFVFPSHHLGGGEVIVEVGNVFRSDLRVVRWHERSVKPTILGTISYQAADAPLAGIIAADSHEELEVFLRQLFRQASYVPVPGDGVNTTIVLRNHS